MSGLGGRDSRTLSLALFGPAGAGKGTQAQVLRRDLGLEHIATGDMLREERARGTEMGRTVSTYLDQGRLVPDDVIVDLLRRRLEALGEQGFVLDGVPRNLAQAKALEPMLAEMSRPLNLVVVLEVPPEQLAQRLEQRAHQEGRTDDTPEVIAERLRIYREETEPVLDYLAKTVRVLRLDGTKPVAAVSRDLLAELT